MGQRKRDTAVLLAKKGRLKMYGNYAPFYRGGFFNPMQPPTMPNMADNQNQYAQQYQTPVQPIQTPVAPSNQANNDMIWVQGEAGAKAYLVAPNNTVTLWDSENPTIYIKSADINGVPSMRILDFTVRTPNAPKTSSEHACQCGDKFVSKEAFNALEAKLNSLEAKYEGLSAQKTTKAAKESEE